ncbi:MAG: Rpn family recombination-promoting nuclease/putative transposase, partial [Eubacteriales bacterium]
MDTREWESLPLSNDFIFSKMMLDEEICKRTIEALLKVKVEKVVNLEMEKAINVAYESKSVRLDVYVKDENRVFNLEMQVDKQKDLAMRSRYYQSMIDLNLIEKGHHYSELKESYVVFICTFDPFKKGLSQYFFENTCRQKPELRLDDKTYRVFFNTDASDSETDENVKCFLDYVTGESSDNDLVQKMMERMAEIKSNEKWKVEFMTMRMKEQDIARDNYALGQHDGMEIGE